MRLGDQVGGGAGVIDASRSTAAPAGPRVLKRGDGEAGLDGCDLR